MSTTYTEMVLLRKTSERAPLPRLWFLHHATVAAIRHGHFEVLERGSRSRYLTSLARLGITPLPWTDAAELRERAIRLAGEL